MKTEPLAASGESSERGGPGEEAGEDRHADAGRRVPVVCTRRLHRRRDEDQYKKPLAYSQIPRVHGLPVARRLALLGPLRARLRDARAVGLAALSIIIITIRHLEPELEELLEAAYSFRFCT